MQTVTFAGKYVDLSARQGACPQRGTRGRCCGILLLCKWLQRDVGAFRRAAIVYRDAQRRFARCVTDVTSITSARESTPSLAVRLQTASTDMRRAAVQLRTIPVQQQGHATDCRAKKNETAAKLSASTIRARTRALHVSSTRHQPDASA